MDHGRSLPSSPVVGRDRSPALSSSTPARTRFESYAPLPSKAQSKSSRRSSWRNGVLDRGIQQRRGTRLRLPHLHRPAADTGSGVVTGPFTIGGGVYWTKYPGPTLVTYDAGQLPPGYVVQAKASSPVVSGGQITAWAQTSGQRTDILVRRGTGPPVTVFTESLDNAPVPAAIAGEYLLLVDANALTILDMRTGATVGMATNRLFTAAAGEAPPSLTTSSAPKAVPRCLSRTTPSSQSCTADKSRRAMPSTPRRARRRSHLRTTSAHAASGRCRRPVARRQVEVLRLAACSQTDTQSWLPPAGEAVVTANPPKRGCRVLAAHRANDDAGGIDRSRHARTLARRGRRCIRACHWSRAFRDRARFLDDPAMTALRAYSGVVQIGYVLGGAVMIGPCRVPRDQEEPERLPDGLTLAGAARSR